jgi:uncharacterized protein YsxB (DUF464 family)
MTHAKIKKRIGRLNVQRGHGNITVSSYDVVCVGVSQPWQLRAGFDSSGGMETLKTLKTLKT